MAKFNYNFGFTFIFQEMVLTWHKDIRPKGRRMCWDVPASSKKAPIKLWECHGMLGNQLWRYYPVSTLVYLYLLVLH